LKLENGATMEPFVPPVELTTAWLLCGKQKIRVNACTDNQNQWTLKTIDTQKISLVNIENQLSWRERNATTAECDIFGAYNTKRNEMNRTVNVINVINVTCNFLPATLTIM
jgi:hypothetical protein